jgi:hypothetical protein
MVGNTLNARGNSPTLGDSRAGFRRAKKGSSAMRAGYWTVGYGGNAFRLKGVRGLGYISHLLRHPGAEFHVLDLYGGIASQREEDETRQSVHGLPRDDEDLENAGIHITGLGDASEMLDEHAKAAYRRRLSELREELKEAKELGNVERAEQAEEEIDALTRELSRAVGLGGRNRRAASASERARQSITKSIETVLERIAQSEATLGDLLSRCIKTGTFCSYQPDPDFPLAWEFAQTPIEQAEQATSSRDLVAVDSDHRQVPPVVLDVSPFSLAERTAIVGRETERRAIRVIIDRARSGHGSLVMLGGEPGVGKTRLAMDIADCARSVSFRSFVGHCYETDDPFPHLPFLEIIESGTDHP